MEIQISKMQKEVSKYEKLLKEYEETYLNWYNEISSSSFFWHDPHAKAFYTGIESEKRKVGTILDEMLYIKNIYTFLIQKYQELGEKIQFELGNIEDIYTYFDTCLNQIDSIINEYTNLSIQYCLEESYILDEQAVSFKQMKNDLQSLKETTKNTYLHIEEIEREVARSLAKINIQKLQKTDIGR